jgi:hypothetical protein
LHTCLVSRVVTFGTVNGSHKYDYDDDFSRVACMYVYYTRLYWRTSNNTRAHGRRRAYTTSSSLQHAHAKGTKKKNENSSMETVECGINNNQVVSLSKQRDFHSTKKVCFFIYSYVKK